MNRKISFLITLLCFMFLNPALSQKGKFEVLYLYNMCRHIEWPATSYSEEFVIGIVGKNIEVEKSLIDLSRRKTIQGFPIVIKKLTSAYQGSACKIIYFSNGTEEQISQYLMTSKNSLFVSESPEAVNKGTDINFFMEEDKLKFVLIESNLSKKNHVVANTLRELATEVQ